MGLNVPPPDSRPRPYCVARRAFNPAPLFAASLLGLAVMLGVPGLGRADTDLRVLALGDSLTAGYGLAPDDSFPAQLEAALRRAGIQARVVNGGVSGDTSAGGLARLDWLLAEKPDLVIVELGANDGLRGLDPASTRDNLDRILARFKQDGIAVLLTGMRAPPNLGQEYGDAFAALYADLARRYGAAFYPFFLDGVVADPALNQQDGIHPNAQGVAEIVARMLPLVVATLKGVGG